MRITSETLEIHCKNIFLNQRREQQCCSLSQEHSDHVQTFFFLHSHKVTDYISKSVSSKRVYQYIG